MITIIFILVGLIRKKKKTWSRKKCLINQISFFSTADEVFLDASLTQSVPDQGFDEIAAEVIIAQDSDETDSGDEIICTDSYAKFKMYNDYENTESHDES